MVIELWSRVGDRIAVKGSLFYRLEDLGAWSLNGVALPTRQSYVTIMLTGLCTVRILKVSNPTYLLQVPKYSNHDLLYVQVLPIQIQRD